MLSYYLMPRSALKVVKIISLSSIQLVLLRNIDQYNLEKYKKTGKRWRNGKT